ncbi:WD repeat-containing protein 78 [Nowakowskiella sp. JEL0407]|nr:WD repeat-containing protein 78 [Nowakowskiella sp. JEL0407]
MRSHNRGNASGISVGAPGEKNAPVLFDEDGNDVTPLPLLPPLKIGHGKVNTGVSTTEMSMLGSTAKESVVEMLSNMESMAAGSFNVSTFGKSMQSQQGSIRGSGASASEDDDFLGNSNDELLDEKDDVLLGILKGKRMDSADSFSNSQKPQFTEAELFANVNIMLSETETIVLYNLPSLSVSNEFTEEITIVKESNAKYLELKASRTNNDNFVDRGMQTFNDAIKNKEVQVSGPKSVNAECMATTWGIYDAQNSSSQTPESNIGRIGNKNDEKDLILESEGDTGGLNFTGESAIQTTMFVGDDNGALMSDEKKDEDSSIRISTNNESGLDNLGQLDQESLRNSLATMERAVVANNYLKKLYTYRDIVEIKEAAVHERKENHNEFDEDLEEEDEEEEGQGQVGGDDLGSGIPTVELLWSYRCELTRGRSVTYMSWNKDNEDILAVGYSEPQQGNNNFGPPGLILCWSLKNLEWPERIYTASSPVTAIDFSKSTPNLLAVGFANGRIAIYDVRKREDKPALDDSEVNGKHRDPVWELKWIERERVVGDEQSKGETLVSISTDGRVTQWMIRKGLESADLMTLKRVAKQESTKNNTTTSSKKQLGPGKSAFISRQTGGLCFDFNPADSNVYLVGTEEGHIHRCSCSYNEQYLFTYAGHTGPVYKTKWSPFLNRVFLSCSSDWTVRLWEQDSEEEVFKFQSGRDSITDIAWNPWCSTIFGCVAADGRMEIWDLQFSVLDPVILHTVLDRSLTSIIFSSQTSAVLIGDDTGVVSVYKLKKSVPFYNGVSAPNMSFEWREEQIEGLRKIMTSKNQTGIAADSTSS